MLIAIISDIHDHITNLREALAKIQDAQMLLCCGDLCSPFIVKELGQGFPDREIHIVFGNNDGDLFRITQTAAAYPNIHLHGEFAELEFDGKKIAMTHFDNVGRALAQSDAYDLVCFGHNHRFEISEQGLTLIVNPGEVMGGLTGHSTCVLYDTAANLPSRLEIG